MQKRIGLISFVALAMLLYLIWKDPSGTAGLFDGFFGAVGDFVGTLWDKLGEFFSTLVN